MHEQSPSSTTQVLWPGALVLASLGFGALGVSLWRAVDVAISHDAAFLAQHQQFQKETVTEIRHLAENAGILTSADLCPVRFRLRWDDGRSIPIHRPDCQLERISATDIVHVAHLSMNAGGTIECGLNPPGNYRLTMEMPDGMSLVHDFDVLPGVPVDRMVVAPRSSAGEETAMQVAIDWGDLSTDTPLMAVCRIEPAPYVHGQWTWLPPANWRPVSVIAGNSAADDAELALQHWRLDADTFSAEEVFVSFQYCQLTEITFLARCPSPVAAEDELLDLGTVRFGGIPKDHGESSTTTTSWFTERPRPASSAGSATGTSPCRPMLSRQCTPGCNSCSRVVSELRTLIVIWEQTRKASS